jgi:hypothetical protein
MTPQILQSLLIVILCPLAAFYTFASLRLMIGAPWLKTLQFIEILVLLYIGGLYFSGLLREVFGLSVGVGMEYYRPGILLLVVTVFTEKMWRYRAGAR